jgi:hypothetical protein
VEAPGVTADPRTIPAWRDPRFATLLKSVVRREAVLLVALYAVPALRPLRRWYWRVMAATMAIGAVYAYVMELHELRHHAA